MSALARRLSLFALVLGCALARSAAQEPGRIEQARTRYPPRLTRALLRGEVPAPEGFDRLVEQRLGVARLAALRKALQQVSGRDNDIAALCLLALKVPPGSLGRPPAAQQAGRMSVRRIASRYRVAPGKTSGWFRTGQPADLMLSGIGFNDTGGPLLFNHPMGVASDGRRLIVSDTYNNRILIWNRLPAGNLPPDLVLGQKNFRTNNPGLGRDQLNWPVSVATDGRRLVATDTNNDRILIWSAFPTRSGAPADIVIGAPREGVRVSRTRFQWPWGVWTDGRKLAVSSTRGGGVLIWNSFPSRDQQAADIVLRGGGKLGTPRHITSDGRSLIVGDHNPRMGGSASGTFFWNSFPTRQDQPFDYFSESPSDRHEPWLRGAFGPKGKLFLLGSQLHVWASRPSSARDRPALSVGGYDFRAGDHTSLALAGARLYVCAGNRNMIVGYHRVPTRPNQRPDFAIGSPDIRTNTLDTNFVISNPVPASNGKNLFVASDFDRRLYVYNQLPDQSGAHPNLVYQLPFAPWDIALSGQRLALAGKRTLWVWDKLPLNGQPPDHIYRGGIGGVRFGELRGVALDQQHLYLGDHGAGKLHVWDRLPGKDARPKFTFEVPGVWRLASDGKMLAVGTFDRHRVLLYPVGRLGSKAGPLVVGRPPGRGRGEQNMFNTVPSALVHGGGLFVVDGGFHRVHVWRRVADAVAGKRADAILGAQNFRDRRPGIGSDQLFSPAALAFDGSYLWVGETKFSERLLRFRPGR